MEVEVRWRRRLGAFHTFGCFCMSAEQKLRASLEMCPHSPVPHMVYAISSAP